MLLAALSNDVYQEVDVKFTDAFCEAFLYAA